MQNLTYQYDNVGNITDIANTGNYPLNGMGGVYANHYEYDNLYRLKKSTGDYLLEMEYKKNGRISMKRQKTEKMDYQHVYTYNHNTNKVDMLKDLISGNNQTIEWDANGNMILQYSNAGVDRHMCWDEENRLMGVRDLQCVSYYQYDGNGERTYKLTGQLEAMHVNGRWNSFQTLNRSTLYASPYLVASNQGYTKHYYAGSQRIASKLGGGKLANISSPLNVDACADKQKKSSEQFNRVLDCLGAEVQVKYHNLYYLHELETEDQPETGLYFYHPDHLGSSAWVTEGGGKAIQHLQYLPFGESFVNQRSSDFEARYTFSAKEKDEETGYGYFGARYYSSDLSIWLSVDPMSSKYPSLSSYAYCANNPVMLTDPDGMEINGDFYDQKGTKIGTDGKKDGKIYIVADISDIAKILMNRTTDVSELKSAEVLPEYNIRQTLVSQLNEQENENNRREYCGIIGTDYYTEQTEIFWGKPGAEFSGNPCVPGKVTLTSRASDARPAGRILVDVIAFHTHSSFPCDNGKNAFDQFPSTEDYNNAINYKGNGMRNFAFGMGNNTLYIYNAQRKVTTFPIDKFGTIK